MDLAADATFSITHTPLSTSQVATTEYSMDFGDGLGKQSIGTSSTVTQAFGLPGEYTVTAYVTDTTGDVPVSSVVILQYKLVSTKL